MITETFTVVGMNCQHCVGSITEEVRGLADVLKVAIDLPSGQLTVTTPDGTDPSLVAAAVERAGYSLRLPTSAAR